IMFNTPKEFSDAEEALKFMLEGETGVSNLIALKNALLRINAQKNRPNFNKVEIRGFTDNAENSPSADSIRTRMEAVKQWLLNPISGFTDDDKTINLRQDEFPAIESK